MSTPTKVAVTILSILVVISLGLNIFLIWQLRQVQLQAQETVREFGPAIQDALSQTIAELETLENTTLEFEIAVEQNFPIDTEVTFNQTIDVPIDLIIPISQVVETTIMIDPLKTGLEIPVDVSVPVDVEIPINETISIPINRTIPIVADVPLKANVPIEIAVGETDLAGYIASFREGLMSINGFIDKALAGVE